MAYLQVGARQYPLVPGENGIGSVEGSRIPVPASHGDPNEMSAVVVVEADGSSIIRRTGAADVTVNGVQLGAEPTPLIHGDKIDVGSTELFFGDDRKAGNTSFVAAVKRPEVASAPAAKRLWVVDYGSTGGRLVSLVDGREYVVPDEGLVVGRDPACDVVVPTGEVSRKHAVIAAGPGGYMITDLSANGLSVNGERVASSCRLGPGDVLKVGSEEFRFHSDVAPARPVLATLEVKSSGVLNGTVFEIRSRLTHIGRGAHNEISLADDSVSDSHAKLQRRDEGWYVVDMGSTNGTYVGGRRILGEALLEGVPDLRVGGLKFMFRPTGVGTEFGGGVGDETLGAETDLGAGGAGQTRAIAALTPEQRARLMAAGAEGRRAGGREVGREPGAGAGFPPGGLAKAQEKEAGVAGERESCGRRRRPSLLLWVVVVVAVAIAVFLLFF